MKYNRQVEEFIEVVQDLAKRKGYTVENQIDLQTDPIDPQVMGDIELFLDVHIDDKLWAVLAGDTYLIRKKVRCILLYRAHLRMMSLRFS